MAQAAARPRPNKPCRRCFRGDAENCLFWGECREEQVRPRRSFSPEPLRHTKGKKAQSFSREPLRRGRYGGASGGRENMDMFCVWIVSSSALGGLLATTRRVLLVSGLRRPQQKMPVLDFAEGSQRRDSGLFFVTPPDPLLRIRGGRKTVKELPLVFTDQEEEEAQQATASVVARAAWGGSGCPRQSKTNILRRRCEGLARS